MTTSTALPRIRDWNEFELPVHWSRYALRPAGTVVIQGH